VKLATLKQGGRDGTLVVVWFQGGKIMSAEGLALTNPMEVGAIGMDGGAQDFTGGTEEHGGSVYFD